MAKLTFGDVIYVKRDCGIFGYKHFGIYSGGRKVIHYVKEGVDAFDGVIRETSLARFLDGDDTCYICAFDGRGRRKSVGSALVPQNFGSASPLANRLPALEFLFAAKEIVDLLLGEETRLYSAQETVERARSRIGERGYNLLLNNCEHFAVWCKTGVEKSEQVDEIIKLLVETALKA